MDFSLCPTREETQISPIEILNALACKESLTNVLAFAKNRTLANFEHLFPLT